MINSIDGMIAAAKSEPTCVLSVAAAHDVAVIEAVVKAKREDICTPILVGHKDGIRNLLEDMGEDYDEYEIIPAGDEKDCAAKAVEVCSQGRADMLLKGIVNTADLMRAVLKREANLRTDRRISHCMFYEIPVLKRMIVITDAAVNTFPDLETKADILENAAICLHALGYPSINAACICGAEQINPKVRDTVEADLLSKMTDRWAPYNMTVFGPAALDLAVSEESCRHKHYTARGGGRADILFVPDYQVGNGIGKAATLFGGARSAGIILGAKVPVILVSRSDNAFAKHASIALGSVLSRRMNFSDPEAVPEAT